jgi:hypothetical protein
LRAVGLVDAQDRHGAFGPDLLGIGHGGAEEHLVAAVVQ